MIALILLGLAAVIVWAGRLALFPFGPCWCARRGRRGRGTGSASRAWSHCRRCDGTGERVRTGARTVRKAIGRPLPEEE